MYFTNSKICLTSLSSIQGIGVSTMVFWSICRGFESWHKFYSFFLKWLLSSHARIWYAHLIRWIYFSRDEGNQYSKYICISTNNIEKYFYGSFIHCKLLLNFWMSVLSCLPRLVVVIHLPQMAITFSSRKFSRNKHEIWWFNDIPFPLPMPTR